MSVKANNIEEALASLDDAARATAIPQLFLRIQGRLNVAGFIPEKFSLNEKIGSLFSRPAIAISFLLLIFFIDGLAIQSNLSKTSPRTENPGEDLFRSNDNEAFFFSTPESEAGSIY